MKLATKVPLPCLPLKLSLSLNDRLRRNEVEHDQQQFANAPMDGSTPIFTHSSSIN